MESFARTMREYKPNPHRMLIDARGASAAMASRAGPWRGAMRAGISIMRRFFYRRSVGRARSNSCSRIWTELIAELCSELRHHTTTTGRTTPAPAASTHASFPLSLPLIIRAIALASEARSNNSSSERPAPPFGRPARGRLGVGGRTIARIAHRAPMLAALHLSINWSAERADGSFSLVHLSGQSLRSFIGTLHLHSSKMRFFVVAAVLSLAIVGANVSEIVFGRHEIRSNARSIGWRSLSVDWLR